MRHRTEAPTGPSPRLSARHAHGAKLNPGAHWHTQPATALHFNIDRITVEGYSFAQQKRFTRSLQSELAALARETSRDQWSGANGLAMNRLDAGVLPSGATPEAAARQIAARIFASLWAQSRRKITRESGGEGRA